MSCHTSEPLRGSNVRAQALSLDVEDLVTDPRRLSDTELDSGARDAQTQFIQENLRRIFLLIYRIVGNVDDAQDLTQETFIKALQRKSQLKELDKAEHWLSRIASNTAIDFLRRHGRVSFCDIEDVTEPVRTAPEESPEQRIDPW